MLTEGNRINVVIKRTVWSYLIYDHVKPNS